MSKPTRGHEADAQTVVDNLGGMCRAADHAIRSLFQVPVKITIVIRVPGLKRGDTVFGDDDPAEAIEAIRRVLNFHKED